MERINLYKQYLDDSFKFPVTFLDTVSLDILPDLEPWRFLCSSEKYLSSWVKEVRKQYPARQLVPFAHWYCSDDIACFDGEDTSGNPKVYFVHAFASPGWEDRGFADNFDEWLKIAKKDSEEYKKEREED